MKREVEGVVDVLLTIISLPGTEQPSMGAELLQKLPQVGGRTTYRIFVAVTVLAFSLVSREVPESYMVSSSASTFNCRCTTDPKIVPCRTRSSIFLKLSATVEATWLGIRS